MKSFRTEINCTPSSPIGLNDSILTMGSCFADQFGAWLTQNKFTSLSNPFGTVYNPLSIHKLLQASSETPDDQFVQRDGLWFHYDYHSHWSALDKQTLNNHIQTQQQEVTQFIQKAHVIVLTYGTAWVYKTKDKNRIVANCHKMPAGLFEKQLLNEQEIKTSFDQLHAYLLSVNPNIRILLTVSPVRHVKDTLPLNQVSKSVLRLACHHFESEYKNVEYFPSYEIMMDDLRDYRFYDRDMIHPSAEAIDYINSKFADRYFEASTLEFIKTWQSIRQALDHRPFHPHTESHQKFLHDLLTRLSSVSHLVSVEKEIQQVKTQLLSHG